MRIDWYTKTVLTVIAVALAIIAVRSFYPSADDVELRFKVADTQLQVTYILGGARDPTRNTLTG